jgi:hypothetical protein
MGLDVVENNHALCQRRVGGKINWTFGKGAWGDFLVKSFIVP